MSVRKVSKPEPPFDLWAQLEKAVNEVVACVPPKPPNGFTSKELAQNLKLTEDQAANRIKKLIACGKVKRVGGPSKHGYYEFIG